MISQPGGGKKEKEKLPGREPESQTRQNHRGSFTAVRSFIIISILSGQKEPSILTG